MDLSTISGLLAFLSTSAFLGFFKSQVLEMLPQFQALDANMKSAVVLVASVAFGVASYALMTYVSPATLTQLQPLYAIVYASVVVWMASQGYHALTKPSAEE